MPRNRTAASTIAVTSGKGGVGKTSLATNLGVALGRLGHRVCLLDADMGLANVNILLGVTPEHTIEDVIAGRRSLREVELSGPEGLRIIPAASGLERITRPGPALRREIASLEQRYDYLIVDTPAGIGASTMSFVEAVERALLIITPEPTSLTDAFTLLKATGRLAHRPEVSVVANMMPVDRNDDRLFTRFHSAVQKHLRREIGYLGSIAMDQAMTRAVLRQTPLLVGQRNAPAAGQIEALTRRLVNVAPPRSGSGGFAEYWCGPPAPGEQDESDLRVREVIAAPPETVEAAEAPPPGTAGSVADGDTLIETARGYLQRPATGESDARRFFAAVESAFASRFTRRSADLQRALEAALDSGALTRAVHLELLERLATGYRERFGEPPPTAETSGGESGPGSLESMLPALRADPAEALRRLGTVVTELIGDEACPEDAVATLLQKAETAYRKRWDRPLGTAAKEAEAGLGSLRRELAERRQALERSLTDVCLILEEHSRLEAALDRRLGGAEEPAPPSPPTFGRGDARD